MALLKQSSTAQPLVFLLVSSTDKATGVTGLTPTVTLSKSGGSFASPAGAITEIGSGWYKVAGNATDTNTLGPLIVHATGTGADPVDMLFEVVAFDPQLTRYAELGMSDADLDEQLAAAIAAGGGGTTVQITGEVTYAGPVAVTGSVAFYRGDAVTLEWTIEDYTGTVADAAVTSLRFIAIDTYRDASQSTYNSSLTKAGTASLTAGTLTLSFTLTASDTSTLTAGANNDGTTRYRAQVIATSTNTTLVDVDATVRRRIGVAS